jgi:hypothetical protein
MKKTLFSLVFALLVLAVPAFGQGNHGGGRGNGGGGGGRGDGGRHAQSQPRHDDRGRSYQRNDRREEREFHANHEERGYHYSEHDRGEFRRHWDGRRFDHDFFEGHWGYGHRFYWGHCGWYGPRWAIGSAFWFDGAYFTIIDTIPYDWYDGEVAVIYDPACDCYFATNPVYPGVRIHVGIRF